MGHSDIPAQLAALPHRCHHSISEAGHHRALLRSDVQPIVEAAAARQRVGAQAEAGGELPLHRGAVGKAQHLLEQVGVGGLRIRGVHRRRLRRGLRRDGRPEHGGVGVVQCAADGALLRKGASRGGEYLHEVGVRTQQIQQAGAAAIQHVGHQKLDGDGHHQYHAAEQQLEHTAAIPGRDGLRGGGLGRGAARRWGRAPPRRCTAARTRAR